MATRPNEGMRKGEIVDFQKVATSVHTALAEAEKMSRTTVDSIYLAQTGAHLVHLSYGLVQMFHPQI